MLRWAKLTQKQKRALLHLKSESSKLDNLSFKFVSVPCVLTKITNLWYNYWLLQIVSNRMRTFLISIKIEFTSHWLTTIFEIASYQAKIWNPKDTSVYSYKIPCLEPCKQSVIFRCAIINGYYTKNHITQRNPQYPQREINISQMHKFLILI